MCADDQMSIRMQAIVWCERLEEGADGQTNEEFSKWVRTSPEHLQEFFCMSAFNEMISKLDLSAAEFEAALSRLRERPTTDEVVGSDPAGTSARPP